VNFEESNAARDTIREVASTSESHLKENKRQEERSVVSMRSEVQDQMTIANASQLRRQQIISELKEVVPVDKRSVRDLCPDSNRSD